MRNAAFRKTLASEDFPMRILMLSLIAIAANLILWEGATQDQPPCEMSWGLPHGLAVKDSGPRTYRFVVDYHSANARGEIVQRQRVSGEYTRGLPGGDVMWKNVTHATVDSATAPFGPAEKRDFMEGFRYHDGLGRSFQPDFFKAFPPTAVMERNLVWDTGMIEIFGQNYFEQLRLNEPYHAISNESINTAGLGTFRNRDVTLEWVGYSKRNGELCALIQYRAFFNPLTVAAGGMTINARSDYWGQIWVSLVTKQIEYGTLYENVTGEMKLPGQKAPQAMNVFRVGSLEPVNGK